MTQVKISNQNHNPLNPIKTNTVAKSEQDSIAASVAVNNESSAKGKNKGIGSTQDLDIATQQAQQNFKNTPSTSSNSLSNWFGDALSLFMFDAAPLIMQLNFKLRETLADAETAESKNQIEAAEASAALIVQQGEADASKMRFSAASEFSGVGTSLFQGLTGLSDEFATNNIFEKELATQDRILSDLSVHKTTTNNTVVAEGAVVNEGEAPAAANRQEDIETLKSEAVTAAKAFKAKYEQELQTLKSQEKSQVKQLQDKIASSHCWGLGKSEELIAHERDLEMSQVAGKNAFDEMINANSNILTNMQDNPEVAAAFINELGSGQSGSLDEQLAALRGIPGDARSAIVRSFGKTQASDAFKAQLTQRRTDITAGLAQQERSIIDRRMQKRDILKQIVTSFAGGQTQLASATATVQEAQANAQSKQRDAVAQVMAAVRGSQDGVINDSLSQVKALFDWYAQTQSQIISAEVQRMA